MVFTSYPILVDTQANILAASGATIGKPTLMFASDTFQMFFCDGTNIRPAGSTITRLSGSSSGITVTGNLNPSITPAINSEILIGGDINITTYTSGSLGFATTYNIATSGTKASQTDNLAMSKGVGAGWAGKNLAASTAGNATGAWHVLPVSFRASGGQKVQLLTNGNFSGKYSIEWYAIYLTGY